ncbi:protein export cytoplasm protein SecA ATPase RNA helicase [Mycoplasma haemofelis str. Langford 1]|uniref:Protein translocase subunit SecA n=2 Tax=Mycoplasma haemofelis TaxID=29501 RepID=F6FFI6_MYCHI|nr:preprotein translocase subunit SecA [Mycoplasma haemofelis]AEG72381.1 preprotein translocase, SecA subunit [Mycoplasma haemofelis Ohio2]CBY92067.1 protein export cytoplasm protein SecA ATPase RNA helicase [Mycoplasma haemofelis str. Langford 1]
MKIFNAFKPAQIILKRITSLINKIDELKDEFRAFSDQELRNKTQTFLRRIQLGESIDDLLPEALATVREATFRVHGMFAYRTQLTSALVIYGGNFAEMKTGEGKTLTVALSAYIASLEQKGVHIITVNEYLVKRDAEFCRKILNFLGMSVGFITSNMEKEVKKEMYACDVTYTTNSELAFDYLRDNMVYDPEDIVIPRLHFAIIDEGDSVLIDEARTPLIISGPDESNVSSYIEVDLAVKKLSPEDYLVDHETRTITLQSTGILKIEKEFNLDRLYTFENSDLIHKIQNALMANFIFENGREYIVNGDQIILVDHYTGRLLYGQTYNAGLHQAIQAKEWIEIHPENKIVANITYQSFFRLYNKIAALSGTALSEAQEFSETYNMIVVPVPTNKPVIRRDLPDIIFGTKEAKIKGIVEEVKRHYIKGQPVLVGTASVYDSEIIYASLQKQSIPCEILNAKNHDKEGRIISQAGRKHAVTIATNIAGRGVDIKINKEVQDLGGLFVLGTERNESLRIDNQLRGRSGRQGDPGKSIFFISLEDELFKRFGGDRFEKLAQKIKDEYFDSKFISRTLTNIQKKIQSVNFDSRKNLIEYSEILSKQQQLIYKQRYFVLTNRDNSKILNQVIEKVTKHIIDEFVEVGELKRINIKHLVNSLNADYFFHPIFEDLDFNNKKHSEIEWLIKETFKKGISLKKTKLDEELFLKYLQRIFIKSIDHVWQDHLDFVSKLKNNAGFHSLEQKSPLNVFIEKTGDSFEELLIKCGKLVLKNILNLPDSPIGEDCYEYLESLREKQEIFKNL